jgi:GNAT superfamily N-acetyltransferase
MTKKQEKELPCPACAAKVTTTVWSSLNVTLNPEAKADLLKGEINLFRCASCGFEGPLPVPLLYHDMDNRFMVQYLPAEALEDGSFYNVFTSDGRLDLGIDDASEASPFAQLFPLLMGDFHVVFSMEELARYVTFRDRLRELRGEGENSAASAESTRKASRPPHWLEQLAADEPGPSEGSPPPITARLDGFHVYEASEDDWTWLADVMVERLWEGVSPLAAEAEQQHRTVTEARGLPIDEEYVEHLRPEGGRRFARAFVMPQIAKIRGPDGYPSALYVARDADLTKAGYVWVGHARHEGTLEAEALIVDLYVVEAHRRKGLATVLMGVAEQWAGQRALNRVVLDFEPDDAPARGLYERLGYKVHTLRMTKTIAGDESP